MAGSHVLSGDRPMFIVFRRTGTPLNAYSMELYKETPASHLGLGTEVVSGKFRSDADGYLDLAMAIEPGAGYSEGLMVLVNNGPAGMVLQPWDADGAKNSWGLASGWFRPSAGVQDIVMGFTPLDFVRGYFSRNSGSPDFLVDPPDGFSTNQYRRDYAVASEHLNDDANLDFGIACRGATPSVPPDRGVALMISDGNPTQPGFTFYPLDSQPVKFLKLADLNRDCRADVIASYPFGLVLHKNALAPASGVDCVP